ncbi:metallo-beta-lactamase domain-containing protein 1 [Octodon degus]|uniref:Metallo-beta-lactamase domain-containing protein 1 n=1 Tax=Octodon degus TaxID=10160 RepID=A0A6P3F540_OCTDE|nr:metallo-beta-lactamase domain-containing protein 1 [Octodon degus]
MLGLQASPCTKNLWTSRGRIVQRTCLPGRLGLKFYDARELITYVASLRPPYLGLRELAEVKIPRACPTSLLFSITKTSVSHMTSPSPPAMSGVVRTEVLSGAPLRVPGDPYSVVVLLQGYSEPETVGDAVRADGSVTLVLPQAWGPACSRRASRPADREASTALEEAARGPILVDTGGPWTREALLGALAGQGLSPGDVTLVVGTHGHSDHIGNLGLFPGAALLVSHDFCLPGGLYLPHGLSEERPLRLGPGLEVWATPGHGGQRDVSVVVASTVLGTVVVAGDVFERDGDEGSWQALSEDPVAQERSRKRILGTANVVVPGHGAPFRVIREDFQPGTNSCGNSTREPVVGDKDLTMQG